MLACMHNKKEFLNFYLKRAVNLNRNQKKGIFSSVNECEKSKRSAVKMPETSQDAFETLFPPKQPISAQELRERSNSLTKKQRQANKMPLEIRVDNPLVAAESNFWPPMPADTSSLSVAAAVAAGATSNRGGREARISVGELDSCYTAPEPMGYKRESSHRYALLPFLRIEFSIFCFGR